MPKSDTIFVCQNCESSFPKWQGQCGQCNSWNSLVEEIRSSKKGAISAKRSKSLAKSNVLVSFSQVKDLKGAKKRFSSQIGELDRVLGGGLVAGMVVLVGGEPGVGKSTLLTQMLIELVSGEMGKKSQTKGDKKDSGFSNKETKQGPIIYVSGEESPSQISLRINRILDNEQFLQKHGFGESLGEALDEQLLFVTTTDVDEIIDIVKKKKPRLLIVDSIQTISTQDLTGASGSVGQIRESTDRLIKLAKTYDIPSFLVGHVTKDGTIAGPKVLEHMVDTVLELSGERTGQLRLIRALKNRFGATDEVGVFRFVSYGLEEVSNPSEIFLENQDKGVAGSATVCIMEGTRPILVEVQALVIKSQLAMPRRVGRGIELSRIQVLAAVLQKHGKLPLGVTDVFLSAAGGFKVKEPSVDLGLAVAIASSLRNKKLPQKTVFIGEIGLLGEVRSVPYLERRIKEAKRLGYSKIISRKTHERVDDLLKELIK